MGEWSRYLSFGGSRAASEVMGRDVIKYYTEDLSRVGNMALLRVLMRVFVHAFALWQRGVR